MTKMVSNEHWKSNKIELNLSDSAIKSGIIDLYIEDNTMAITVEIQQKQFMERIAIVESWDRIVNTLKKKVRDLLSKIDVKLTEINEIEFQISNTLNQNYHLIKHQ